MQPLLQSISGCYTVMCVQKFVEKFDTSLTCNKTVNFTMESVSVCCNLRSAVSNGNKIHVFECLTRQKMQGIAQQDIMMNLASWLMEVLVHIHM